MLFGMLEKYFSSARKPKIFVQLRSALLKAHIFLHEENSIGILINCLSRQPVLRKWIKTTCICFPLDYNNEWPFPHKCLRNFRVPLNAIEPSKTFSFLARLGSFNGKRGWSPVCDATHYKWVSWVYSAVNQ